MKTLPTLFPLWIAAFALIGPISFADEGDKPVIYVPVPPYVFLFEQIGGDAFDVRAIVGESDDPHEYSPTPKQLAELSRSRLICAGELGFEANFFVKVGDGHDAPEEFHLLEGLDLLEGFCDHPSHREDPDGKAGKHDHHDHEAPTDPHTWLSPTMLERQSEKIAKKLGEIRPEKEAEIRENLADFQKRLKTLDGELRGILEASDQKKFYVYHGAFAYFARDYGVEQVAVESGNRGPTSKELVKMVENAKREGITTVFVQPQFDTRNAEALAASIDGEIAILDPLEKNLFENLLKIARAIAGDP